MLHAWSYGVTGNVIYNNFKFHLDACKKSANKLNTSVLDTYKENEDSAFPKNWILWQGVQSKPKCVCVYVLTYTYIYTQSHKCTHLPVYVC